MGKYNDQQLQEMKDTAPAKYFYYSHEDDFNKIGIDIDSDNWELPIYHQAGPQGERDKYTYFQAIVTAPGGATVVNPRGCIVNISGANIKTVSEKPGEKPEFKLKEPGPAPREPSRWLRFLNTITFGFYGAAALEQYDQALEEYEEKTETYNRELDRYNRRFSEYEKRAKAAEDHRANLEKMGKDLDKVDAAIAEHAEIAKRLVPLNSSKFDVRSIVEHRAHGRERFDFLMGRRLDAEKNERAKQDAINDKILPESVFDSKIGKDVLMDIKLPECKNFSDHQIALLGFAAFSTNENMIGTPTHPIPGQDIVKDTRTEEEKDQALGTWYIKSEALFTRQHREISHAIPWVNNARATLAKALESYNNGRKGQLAGILFEGLRKCTQQVMFHDSVLDSNTLADYATYAGEMLDIIDHDEELRLNMVGYGCTQKDFHNASICRNIGKVWDRGIDAMEQLVDNPDLKVEQKIDAIVDIIGLRITQSMIFAHSKEISGSELYKKILDDSYAQAEAVRQEMDKMLHSDADRKKPEYIALDSKRKAYTAVSTQLQSGSMHNKFGLSIDFGKNIDGMYSGNGMPEELRKLIRSKVGADIEKLAALSNDDILMELTPEKSRQYVAKTLAKNEVREMENQPDRIGQKEMNGQIKGKPQVLGQ